MIFMFTHVSHLYATTSARDLSPFRIPACPSLVSLVRLPGMARGHSGSHPGVPAGAVKVFQWFLAVLGLPLRLPSHDRVRVRTELRLLTPAIMAAVETYGKR